MHIFVPPHVVLRAEPSYFNSWIAFNSRIFQTIYLSHFELLLLEELKTASVEENDFHAIWQVVSPDGAATLESLLKFGILLYSEEPVSNLSNVSLFSPSSLGHQALVHLSTPTELELCLTRRCNQTCVHCNVSAISQRSQEKSDTAFWLNVLDQAAECRVLRVTLTGGEPFVRSDIVTIINHLSTKPIGCIILTNAMKITDEQMVAMRNQPISLSISLDGVNAEQHDKFRRTPGAFNATLDTMKRLRKNGISFVISSVLHEYNTDSAVEFLKLAEHAGAFRLIIVPMAAVGRARSQPAKSYFPDSGRLRRALAQVRDVALKTPGLDVIIGSGDPEFRELVTIEDRHSGATAMSRRNPGLCKAGVYSMAVDADGTVYSCLRGLQERIHPIGNIKSQTLLEVWESTLWNDFRDLSISMVPCRVEEIGKGNRKTPLLHQVREPAPISLSQPNEAIGRGHPRELA
jgi:MoaA/NifB/PqqE/SkfB family radical SAM enzyme